MTIQLQKPIEVNINSSVDREDEADKVLSLVSRAIRSQAY